MTTTPIFSGKIDYKEIKTWDQTEFDEKNLVNDKDKVPIENFHINGPIQFKIDTEINSRICLWMGDICNLNTDTIVYSNSKTLTESDTISDKIFKYGGSEMMNDIQKNGECRYGESIITSGGNLPSRFVVHTVCPTYNPKYLSAAENALNSCYRSAFHLSMDVKSKSISFSTLHSEKRQFPSVGGCHIALRTIRRFLEKPFSKSFEKVILAINTFEDLRLYEQMLPIYFPRNQQELKFSQISLPKDVGDENGEAIVESRKIRIIETPSTIIREPEDYNCFYSNNNNNNNNVNNVNNNNSNNNNSNNNNSSSNNIDIIQKNNKNEFNNYKYDSIDKILNPFSSNFSSSPYDATMDNDSFMLKREDPDIEKRRQFSKKSEKQIENEKLKAQFQTLLTRSKVEDLSDVSRLNFTLQTTDDQNRPIVVIIGSQLNSRKDLYDQVLLYLIRVLEQTIQRGNFSIIYFHSNMSSQQSPDLSWLKKLLEIFELKYNNYLKDFNIVHPTFLLKTTLFISKSILGDKGVLSKIIYHENMNKISKLISKCNIPKSIFSYEFSKNEIDNFSFSFDNDVTL
ncbi:ganglioside induced differentiation associated protein 2 [Dictyostelium discoideum AX4]|uniref:Protein GDAP2 homolog n=1 Tax=Dictyostelium discoideum TaxID=44689 RepID=GDAP2_DICDI|nr:ganglioside induced differentiation associated protein 2 [Dictyostelium discoideum AX4]Q54PT1.1 RecName: Full=Protein GDAP2 homolog [Dictyostelium discoideum]EAL65223.1 ganglioside induced differentiation associated protein 2 [Dictyostelium discoideum AX4]|eukprot:XP_638573.1 ganglioside induced differentiation associated protein 2 [Dictyostelium discoideum AX4]